MMIIGTLNKISPVGLARFDEKYTVSEGVDHATAVIVRSAAMHDMEFPEELEIIARAGVGVNNIPLDKCAENGIAVVNAPGANANGVKELVICSMIMAYRNLNEAITWASSLRGTKDVPQAVEQGKSNYKGREIAGKTLGVIGLGVIGGSVANACKSLGMRVVGYDKYINDDIRKRLDGGIKIVDDIKDVVKECDFLTVHVHANSETNGMINDELLGEIKEGAILLNFARASIADDDAVKRALQDGRLAKYITDFPSQAISDTDNVIMIPHLGASTDEAEDNCAIIAADEIITYLETGNLINSVNFPSLDMGRPENNRLCILSYDDDAMLSRINDLVTAAGDVLKIQSNSNGEYAYTVIETDADPSEIIIDDDSVIKSRWIMMP